VTERPSLIRIRTTKLDTTTTTTIITMIMGMAVHMALPTNPAIAILINEQLPAMRKVLGLQCFSVVGC